MKKYTLVFGFLSLLFLPSVLAAPVDREVVLAIAGDLEALIGETVDEGEWSARIKRDKKNFPNDYSCVAKDTHKGPLYICSFGFILTPNSSDFADGQPWSATCTNLLYFVEKKNGKIRAQNYKDSVQSCLETLNEGP